MKTLYILIFLFLLAVSTYSQIEQFATKSMRSEKVSDNSLRELSESVKNTAMLDSIYFPSFAFQNAFLPTDSTLKINKEFRSFLKRQIDIEEQKAKNKKDDSLLATLKQLYEKNRVSDSIIQVRNDELKLEKNNYLVIYNELLKSRFGIVRNNYDTISGQLKKLKPLLDSIKIGIFAELKDDDSFNGEEEAKKMYKLRWRLSEREQANLNLDKVITILENDLSKQSKDTLLLQGYKKTLDSIVVQVNKSISFVKDLNDFTAHFTQKLNKHQEENGMFKVGAQPDVLANFANSNVLNVIPALNIVGGYYYSKGENGVYASLRLFSGYSSTDTANSRNGGNLWLSEASMFGISFDVAGVFVQAKKAEGKKIALRFMPSFLIKNTPVRSDDSTFSGTANGVGVMHFRLGLEYSPIKFLVLYGNLNYVTPVTQIETFNRYFMANKTHYPFFDFGFRSPILINNKEKNNTTINIDVNFIGISGDLKAIYKTNDVIIPSIRLGVVQQFSL